MVAVVIKKIAILFIFYHYMIDPYWKINLPEFNGLLYCDFWLYVDFF